MKYKNHMIISVDAEKSHDKIQQPLTIKTLSKVRLQRTYLNITKALYDKLSIILKRQKLQAFLL